MNDTTGWLLERPSGTGAPLYHSLTVGHPWETPDHLKALRFARKEDAEAFIAAGFSGEDEYNVVEHMWCAQRAMLAARPAAPAQDGFNAGIEAALQACIAIREYHNKIFTSAAVRPEMDYVSSKALHRMDGCEECAAAIRALKREEE
jgi:hypothetical protein